MVTARLLLPCAILFPVATAYLTSTPIHRPQSGTLHGASVRPFAAPIFAQRPLREAGLHQANRRLVSLRAEGEKSQDALATIKTEDLEQAFLQMDKDKSGELSQEEVSEVLKELGYTTVESKCLFDHMDVDHNGKITQTEFLKGCITEGICAIDDDAHNYDAGSHPVVSVDDNEAEDSKGVQMRGFYARLLEFTAKQKILGEAGKVKVLKTEDEFEEVIAAAGEKPVIIKFYAEWCRKCIAMAPKYKKMAAGYGDRAIFVKLNIEKFGELAKNRAGVVAIPTFMVWKGGQAVDKYVAGSVISKVPGELAQMIDKNLACGFSLVDEIRAPEEKVKVKVELGESQVNMDAMAAWRAAQAAKGSRRK